MSVNPLMIKAQLKLNRRFKILCIAILLGLFACDNTIPFDKSKWEIEADGYFPYRSNMVDDLLESTEFKGKTIREVFETLGKHDDWCDHNMHEMTYRISKTYNSDFTKSLTTNLVFLLDPSATLIDSSTVVVDVRIDELAN